MSWFQKARRLHGHTASTGGPPDSITASDDSRKTGVVIHSADGYQGTMENIVQAAGAPSWHLSIYYDGTVAQHYDSRRITWHSGTRPSNRDHFGIELEGRGNQVSPFDPITEDQLNALYGVLVWLAQDNDWSLPVQWGRGLKDHNDIVPTACPHDRLTTSIRARIQQRLNTTLNPEPDVPALTEEEKDNLMLSKTIVGLDGQPLSFPVLGPGLTTIQRRLTYGEYLQMDALGLLIRPGTHTHTGSSDGPAFIIVPRTVLPVQYGPSE